MSRPKPLSADAEAASPQAARILARWRAGRLPHRDGLWPGRRRHQWRGGGRDFRRQGPAAFNPLIVHVADIEEAAPPCGIFARARSALAEAFWPGALTLVLPRRKNSPLSLLVSAGLDTVALRAPSHPAALALLQADRPARRRAHRQSVRPGQRHHRRPCRRRPGRQGGSDSGWRAAPRWAWNPP